MGWEGGYNGCRGTKKDGGKYERIGMRCVTVLLCLDDPEYKESCLGNSSDLMQLFSSSLLTQWSLLVFFFFPDGPESVAKPEP